MNQRYVACGFIAGGVLFGIGGMLHPVGSGDNVDDHLISMFTSSLWNPSHLLQMVGLLVITATYVVARRRAIFGRAASVWLTVAALGTAFAAFELIPHLAAAAETEDLRRHLETPILDFHMAMAIIASPALGLTTAAVAVAIARAEWSPVGWALAALAVVCGVVSAFAGPLVVLTENVAFSALFPFQAGLAVWMIGIGIRLLRSGNRAFGDTRTGDLHDRASSSR